MKRLLLVLALLISAAGAALADSPALDDAALRVIPIQNQGRIKPIDTFARESVLTITGKERFDGRAPLDLILTWLDDPKKAASMMVIDVSRQDVRAALGLPADARYTSIDTLLSTPTFEKQAREVMRKQQASEELTELDRQIGRLTTRVSLLQSLLTLEAFTVVPDKQSLANPWHPLSSLIGPTSPLDAGESAAIIGSVKSLVTAHAARDTAAFTKASQALSAQLSAVGPGPDPVVLAREVQYNALHPFGKAWMLYLAAVLVLGAAGALGNRRLYGLGVFIAVAGLIMHVYGFYLRCTIAGRPPVTNMYESVIWVSLGVMVFALLLEAVFRAQALVLPAAVAATICLIVADNVTSILDPAINPLTPVLRSNFWLTIHVLTITLSYGAFLLATAIGHVSLFTYGFHPKDRARQRSLHQQLYKTVQLGVMLLAAGTILGGVWANYSWGRFWGWDPKEVWALIALLGYLAVLHGRYAGWLKDFGFSAGCVVAYCGVLMAWYGVNFVLGAGLHSYGFGDGGQLYVAVGVALDLLYVAVMGLRYRATRMAAAGGEAAE